MVFSRYFDFLACRVCIQMRAYDFWHMLKETIEILQNFNIQSLKIRDE